MDGICGYVLIFHSPHRNIGLKPSTFAKRYSTIGTEFERVVDDHIYPNVKHLGTML
jgi:hypothetical protein